MRNWEDQAFLPVPGLKGDTCSTLEFVAVLGEESPVHRQISGNNTIEYLTRSRTVRKFEIPQLLMDRSRNWIVIELAAYAFMVDHPHTPAHAHFGSIGYLQVERLRRSDASLCD